MKEVINRVKDCISKGSPVIVTSSIGDFHIYSTIVPVDMAEYDDVFIIYGSQGEEAQFPCINNSEYDEMLDSFYFNLGESEISIQFM